MTFDQIIEEARRRGLESFVTSNLELDESGDTVEAPCSLAGQQAQYGEPCQETRSDGSIELLIPPTLRGFIGDMALNQQWEADVSVRDTHPSDA